MLLLDENLSHKIVDIVAARCAAITRAKDHALERASDGAIMNFAHQHEEAILVLERT